jgi:hypothetical protein
MRRWARRRRRQRRICLSGPWRAPAGHPNSRHRSLLMDPRFPGRWTAPHG